MTSIQEVLNELKSQLDENFTRPHSRGLLDRDDKDVLREECHFEGSATLEEIKLLEEELGVIFPSDYKEFLLLHDGMTLFSTYMVEYRFFSLDEIRAHHSLIQEERDEDLGPSKDYPIGEYPDVGYIMMNTKRAKKKSSQGAIYIGHIMPEETEESFVSFVEKVIKNTGEFFWEDPNLEEY